MLNLFCEVYNLTEEHKKHIKGLMKIAYHEGCIDTRDEYMNKIANNYGNTIRHHSGAAQN